MGRSGETKRRVRPVTGARVKKLEARVEELEKRLRKVEIHDRTIRGFSTDAEAAREINAPDIDEMYDDGHILGALRARKPRP